MNAELQPVLNTRDAAAYLGLCWETLRVWRGQGKGPRYVRYCSHCIRYRVEDLDAYKEAHLVDPASKAK